MFQVHAYCAVMSSVLGVSPVENVLDESVDLIEVNHCYDDEGRHVFDQVLFYDWAPHDRHYHVRAWRLLKDPAQVPYRDAVRGDYEATWYDGWVMRRVRAKTFRETWTQHDPEVAARNVLPKELRRELLRPSTSTQITR